MGRRGGAKNLSRRSDCQLVLMSIIVFIYGTLKKVYLGSGDQKQSHCFSPCPASFIRKIAELMNKTIALLSVLESKMDEPIPLVALTPKSLEKVGSIHSKYEIQKTEQ